MTLLDRTSAIRPRTTAAAVLTVLLTIATGCEQRGQAARDRAALWTVFLQFREALVLGDRAKLRRWAVCEGMTDDELKAAAQRLRQNLGPALLNARLEHVTLKSDRATLALGWSPPITAGAEATLSRRLFAERTDGWWRIRLTEPPPGELELYR